jgi:hypothetical protein
MGRPMNNVIRFPGRKARSCAVCESWPIGRRDRLLIDDIPLKATACDDCLLAFWEYIMATEPARRHT